MVADTLVSLSAHCLWWHIAAVVRYTLPMVHIAAVVKTWERQLPAGIELESR